MESINKKINYISYPFTSNITYKKCNPFIRIITNNYVYYGFETKQLLFIDFNNKLFIPTFDTYQKPTDKHKEILNLASNKLRGISYQCIYVSNHKYLCLGIINGIYTSLVILTIELNSKGYYEIQGIQDIVKEKKKPLEVS